MGGQGVWDTGRHAAYKQVIGGPQAIRKGDRKHGSQRWVSGAHMRRQK